MFKSIKNYFVKKNNWKKYLFIFLLAFGFIFSSVALAQDFGTDAVGDGLGGVLGEDQRDPRELAGKIINFALGFLGLIAVLIIIYAGFKWMTSGGSEDKIAAAKKTLIAGVIGLIIILSSWALATFILSRFGEVINNGGDITYNDGDIRNCGCGGYTVFSNGSWGPCIGGYCSDDEPEPTSCNANPFGGICSPLSNICAEGSYCDDNCLCQPAGQAGDSCNLNTDNNGVCAPNENFCGSYLVCDPNSCTCLGSPVITGISPLGGFCQSEQNKSCKIDSDCSGETCNLNAPNGAAGNFLTISGKNFGEYNQGSSRVTFLGSGNEREALNPANINPSCVNSWQDEQIIIAIPNGAGTGPIKVENNGLFDSTNDSYGPVIPDFRSNSIIRPGLCKINPSQGLLNTEVSYQGINLYNSTAYFGNDRTNVAGLASNFTGVSGLSGTARTPNIKAGKSGTFVRAQSNGTEENSNSLLFIKEKEVNEGAFISYFWPLSGNVGQYVTIFGSGFGSSKGATKIYFGKTEAVYDFPEPCLNSVWKDDQVTVKVPAGLDDGNYVLSINLANETINTNSINPSTFTFDKNLALKTSLCKINPIRGPAGTKVSLWGEYFGALKSQVTVKFNGANSNFNALVEKDGRADYILAEVPQDAITGPVRVLKGGTYGNELNFSVGSCSSDGDCGSQVCCPKGTYKEGECSNSLNQCYIDIPSSVYEWNFNTNFNNNIVDENESCAGLAAIYGACFTGGCPNTPGSCSPYSGGQKIFSQDCSQDCSLVSGCRPGENSCYYDVNSDRCLMVLENGNNSCSLDQAFEFEIEAKTVSVNGYCNANNHWEIVIASSCPEGFTRGQGNKCVDLNSDCSVCDYGLECEALGGLNRCVAPKTCPSGTVCESVNGSSSGDYKCASTNAASCDCCCTVGQSARDCCAYEAKDGTLVQLQCGGTCGSDSSDDGAGFGRCGGCAAAGDTSLERDLACNCTGSSGQYCEANDSKFPSGFCTDCSSLSPEGCLEHAAFCCLDSKGTADASDDICRGGAGDTISDDPANPNFGYCAYYNCADNENICASTYPVKIGSYSKLTTCEKSCVELDPCTAIGDNFEACSSEGSGKCCFDAKTNTCSLGSAITSGALEDLGYCAYYNCAAGGGQCASDLPLKIGTYKNLAECGQYCANPPAGMGTSCSNISSNTCDVSVCNAPGFACLTDLGGLVNNDSSDCGACCCQPVTVAGQSDACKNVNEVLSCMPDKGNCSGASRGLCCGASRDSDCGNIETIGRGNDTCCEARPEIITSSPEHLAIGVCRNALLNITFNQLMNFNSLENNIILVEEKNPSSGLCPSGTMVAYGTDIEDAFANKNLFVKLKIKLKYSWQKLALALSKSYAHKALANQPSDSNLYCAVEGNVSIKNDTTQSTIGFAPKTLLSPATNYYLVVKGDENLNSQTGVISLKGVGFNGKGYLDISGVYVEGENIAFNGRNFINSQIIKFSTLSSQGATAGICLVDRLAIEPSSYLFNTTNNALNSEENDVPGPGNFSFDTKVDRDKVFAAGALSSDGQHLKPVSGYAWDYEFNILDQSIVQGENLSGLPINQYFVKAVSGITDGETKIKAEIKMDRFSETGSCNANSSCSCSSSSCPENCCNLSFGGDGFNTSANIYVFLCANPWPKVKANGTWEPWSDTANNCDVLGGSCPNFNYKFYYCRDAGNDQTFDDLPAILNQPIVIGQTNSLVCSSDKSISCTVSGERCGSDGNKDGLPDGVCVWDVLKESYFFREDIPASGEITSAKSLEAGSGAEVNWRSGISQAATYKVYYLRSGRSEVNFQEYSATNTNICQSDGQFYNCSAIISGLDNNVSYVFKVGVISANKAESQAANERIVAISDKVAPAAPSGLRAVLNKETKVVSITWTENNDDSSTYRLYRGLSSGIYGDYYEAVKKDANFKTELNFLSSELSLGLNYFVISAFDASGNESSKSNEVVLEID